MILFENASLWDGFAEVAQPGTSVLVEGEVIRAANIRVD